MTRIFSIVVLTALVGCSGGRGRDRGAEGPDAGVTDAAGSGSDAALDASASADAGPADGGSSARGGAGAPCVTSEDCGEVRSAGGTGSSPDVQMVPQVCLSQAASGLPGGLCTMTDCVMNFRRDPCPSGTQCVALTGSSVCLAECAASSCRAGWTCRADIDSASPLCWLSCAVTGCGAGLVCAADGTCGTPVNPPVDYDVQQRSVALGAPLAPLDASAADGANLPIRLPFEIRFFNRTFAAGSNAVASWQGLFAFDRASVGSFVPGDHTRYGTAAPLIAAHHFGNTASSGGSVGYRVSGTTPNRSLAIEWTTVNLSGSGGARFRLRFDEGSPAIVVHYGAITDDVFAESWTQLAMLDGAQFEEVVVSTGSPAPSSTANTEYTYTPL